MVKINVNNVKTWPKMFDPKMFWLFFHFAVSRRPLFPDELCRCFVFRNNTRILAQQTVRYVPFRLLFGLNSFDGQHSIFESKKHMFSPRYNAIVA